MCSGSCERGNRIAPGKREDRDADRSAHVNSSADSRRRCALDHGSSRPCASSSWRKRLRAAPSFHSRSRRMISSSASAARVAIAGRHLRASQLEARLVIVGVCRQPRLERAPCRRPARRRDFERRAARGRSPASSPARPAARRAARALRRSRRRQSAPAARPPITSALSGAMSRTWRKMLTARGASPSASTCSPIATSGSISACGAAPSGSIFSWAAAGRAPS